MSSELGREGPLFVFVENFRLPVGASVIVQQHPGCRGSEGKISNITTATDYEVRCDMCFRSGVYIDIPNTIKLLMDTRGGE